jgi:hypothetical protein
MPEGAEAAQRARAQAVADARILRGILFTLLHTDHDDGVQGHCRPNRGPGPEALESSRPFETVPTEVNMKKGHTTPWTPSGLQKL